MGKNIVIALALVSAGFFAAYLRFRPYLGNEGAYTDGLQNYERAVGPEIRYAVWEGRQLLSPSINTDAAETRAAVSPDGRWIVFSAGEEGLNSGLYIADFSGGKAGQPRLLEELETAADEMAPAFGPDALYFASNRSGGSGGLDLYQASYADGEFGPAQPVPGVNTESDESDPAAFPTGGGLLFASNRNGSWDLFSAHPAQSLGQASAGGSVRSLEPVNSLADDREPALSMDGTTLFFASDREPSAGDFDLFRSVYGSGGWLRPEALVGLNGPGSERAPLPMADGFTLLFSARDRMTSHSESTLSAAAESGRVGSSGESSTGATGELSAPDLWRARSRELFRLPGRPVGLLDVLILIGLLLLALLAWLAKRWRELEVLYKCFLVSALAHGALVLWFQYVRVEGGQVDLPGRDALFQVSLASSGAQASSPDRERSGHLAAEPSERAISELERRNELPADALDVAALEPTALAQLERANESSNPIPRHALPAPARVTFEAASRSELRSQKPDPRARDDSEAPALAMRSQVESMRPEARSSAAATAVPRRSEARRELQSPAAQRTALSSAVPAPLPKQSAKVAALAEPMELAGSSRTSPALAGPELSTRAAAADAETSGESLLMPAARRTRRDELALDGPQKAAVPSESKNGPAPSFERRQTVGAKVAEDQPKPERASLQALAAPVGNAGSEVHVSTALKRPVASADQSRGAPIGAVPASKQAEMPLAAVAGLDPQSNRSQAFEVPKRALNKPAPGQAPRPLRIPDLVAVGATSAAAPRKFEPAQVQPKARTASSVMTRPRSPQLQGAVASALQPSAIRSAPKPNLPSAERLGSIPLELPSVEDMAPSRFVSAGPKLERFRPELSNVVVERLGREVLRSEAFAPERVAIDRTPYRTRFGTERERALREFGGTEETERAVADGLAYLARAQNSRGYWGSSREREEKYGEVAIGKSGLALLAFLGAGHTPRSTREFAQVSQRAVDWLLSRQNPQTGHFGDGSSYSHGIATYALAECFAMEADEALRRPLELAVARILQAQDRRAGRRSGGWGYYFAGKSRAPDDWPRVSISSWQVMALESARLGGLDVPDQAFAAAKEFLSGSLDRRGWFRYSHDPNRLNSGYPTLPASTPAALFALSLLGEDIASQAWKAPMAFTLERAPTSFRTRGDDRFVFDAVGNMYFWYYGSLALFRHGGSAWSRWNSALQETLLPAQERDGSWRSATPYSKMALDTQDHIYSTAMCVLTLEVYYRYFTPLLKVE